MNQKTYRIGEAAAKLHLKSYVLRFWETEFPQIAPIRTEKGQRLYTESDLAVLGRIRYLLHERGLTIDGARRLLREEAAKGVPFTDAAALPDDYLTDEFLEDVTEAGDDAEPLSASAAAPEPGNRASVQASLFPAAGPVLPKEASPAGFAPAGFTVPAAVSPVSPALSANELRAVITELAAIRRLLVAATSGDAS